MVYVIVDNTKNLQRAIMTPKLISFFVGAGKQVVVVSETADFAVLEGLSVDGVVLSGGPVCLSEATELFKYSKNFTALIEFPEAPVLGICFGFQIMASAYGGEVQSLEDEARSGVLETIVVEDDSILFKGMGPEVQVYQSHSDHVHLPPSNFRITAMSVDGIVQAFECPEKRRFGVQFHPEGSPHGKTLLENYLHFCEGVQAPPGKRH